MTPKRVRVIPDLPAVAREFDYLVPEAWHRDGRSSRLTVGSMVRIPLHGRKVAGWVSAIDPETPTDIKLSPLAKLSGMGPEQSVIDLARWASWRWAGPVSSFLGTASPPKMVPELSAPRTSMLRVDDRFDRLFRPPPSADPSLPALSVLRWPPAADLGALVAAAVRNGPSIIVVPRLAMARSLAVGVRKDGGALVLHSRDWAIAAGGTSTIGTRSAIWARVSGLKSILILDEHAESHQEERSPSWHARDVGLERARQLGIPCVLVSPLPTVEAVRYAHRAGGKVRAVSRQEELDGWASAEVVDRRNVDITERGLFGHRAVDFIRESGRKLVVVNRTGRSKMLVCRTCDSIAECERCNAVVGQPDDDRLVCQACQLERPVVCANCGSGAFKNLRLGITRAAEELQALIREPIAEVTAKEWVGPSDARVVIGTEAVLHQVTEAAGVAFLDMDQELLAPRFRAREQALAKLALASRIVEGRQGRVLIQTRSPDNVVLQAAVGGEPMRVTDEDQITREMLQLPPYGGLARITGAAAGEYAAALGQRLGVTVVAVDDNDHLVRASNVTELADALAATPRPKGRLRVVVDPTDV